MVFLSFDRKPSHSQWPSSRGPNHLVFCEDGCDEDERDDARECDPSHGCSSVPTSQTHRGGEACKAYVIGAAGGRALLVRPGDEGEERIAVTVPELVRGELLDVRGEFEGDDRAAELLSEPRPE